VKKYKVLKRYNATYEEDSQANGYSDEEEEEEASPARDSITSSSSTLSSSSSSVNVDDYSNETTSDSLIRQVSRMMDPPMKIEHNRTLSRNSLQMEYHD